ncbi:MAG: AI-2E family transporter [Rhodobiaceae bacterium]|nr:AI-2E family transporter [Rhodobiaceae bacterium]MCC0057146.1 AI-2E family transporter [Rhodobiaceae bacterium]
MARRPYFDARLRPRTGFEIVLERSARLALVGIGLTTLAVVLYLAKVVFAPIALAVVIGLMFGPLATRVERLGIPPAISASLIVIIFVGIIAAFIAAFAVPLSNWVERLPEIWRRLQAIVRDWQGVISSIGAAQKELRGLTGSDAAMSVKVEEGGAVESVAILAPAIVAQFIIFVASLYFYVASRDTFRFAVLRLCINRRLRWRIAHVFRDVERLVSRYLLSITLVNIGLGAVVALALWSVGVESALLWGVLAGVLNYVIYVGPAIMVVILAGVGLAGFDGSAVLLPPAIYLFCNFLEAQFVTPYVIGRNVTLNPFVVFLSIVFWLWLWGPIGGFVAVPLVLIFYTIFVNIVPVERTTAGR